MINIIPINDLIEHIESSLCWCKPRILDDNIILHNSADGREFFEDAKLDEKTNWLSISN